MLATRRKGSLVGLDITTSSVKLIELAESGRGYRVDAYAAEPTPPNAINEKAIVDAEAVGEAIRRAIKRSGTKTRDAAIAISGDAAITKVIQMPKNLSPSDLEGQVELQADQYIPFPMEEVSFDFEVIGESERDPDMVDVLLVATRTENVEQRQVAVEAAGLSARVVDVEAFAVENACQLLTHQMADAGADKFVAIVDFGASTTTFSVLKDLKVIYTRDFAFGGQQLTEEIMRTYGLSMEDAGRAKKEGGLPSNYQPEVLDAFIDDMSQQVSRSLQFFLASGSGREQPDQILICGGCANIPGVADVIGSRVGINTQIGDPLGPDENLVARKGAGCRQGCHGALDRMRPRFEEFRLNAKNQSTALARRAAPEAQERVPSRAVGNGDGRRPARLRLEAHRPRLDQRPDFPQSDLAQRDRGARQANRRNRRIGNAAGSPAWRAWRSSTSCSARVPRSCTCSTSS